MQTRDFDFELPPELIAQYPAAERTASRLLRLDGDTGALADAVFGDLPDFINPGDLLIFNDTRVIKARLMGVKASGGKVEVLIERVLDQQRALAHVRASKSPKPGMRLWLEDAVDAEVLGRQGDLFELRFETEALFETLEQYGRLPLPPYISHTADPTDEARYQTVYARQPGAVAAPTAGLHFDTPMLQRLREKGVNIAYVTLHVGAGTFQPIRTENPAEHVMHSEWYEIPAETAALVKATQLRGGKITAVGTTAMRALESGAQRGAIEAGSGDTTIFITPGYRFRVVQRLLTNFHLPRTTLIMLVSAFAGVENIRHAYQHAIAQRYRFFSYGDAMLIERREPD